MNDLNDLVWTQPSGAGANSLAPGRTSSPFASSFDMLAGSSAQSPANRSYTSSPMPRALTPSSAAAQPPRPPANGAAGGSDAFAGLFSLGGASPQTTGLSLAQRQAKLAAEQQEKKAADTKAFQASGSFWDSLDNGQAGAARPAAATAAAAAPLPTLAPAARTSTPLLVPSPRPTTPSSPLKPSPRQSAAVPTAPTAKPSLDPWDEFDVLASRPAPAPSTSAPALSTPRAADPFDLFNQPAPAAQSSRPAASRTVPPKDFDSADKGWGGDDARGLMAGGDGSDDDDFMQAFNKPQRSQPVQPPKAASRIARPSSPPIHLIGQLVEMGFSPSAAREALASTESGQDVETAAAMLLSAAGGECAGPPSDDDDDDDHLVESERQRKEEEEAERRRRRRQGPSRSAAVAPDRTASPANADSPAGDLAAPLQDLLATTNLIGQSVFNRANAFWSSSKQQVQKAYEERQKANGSPAPSAGPRDGRPKWMVDAAAAAEDEGEWKAPVPRQDAGGFRDGHDEDDEPRAHRSQGQVNAQASSSRRPPAQQQQQQQQQAPVPSLFEPEQPRSYTSSRRHPSKPSAPAVAPSPAPRPPSRQPSPAVPLKQRKLVPAPPQILAAAAGYRTKGNDAFKLGQFGEAEAAYTAAIDILPDHHLRLIPLLNNRAAARLKNGDHAASVADATTVVGLVGLDYDPAKEVPLPADLADLALGDALVKAVSKRAAALEMGERWAQARDDWEVAGRLDACKGPARAAAMDGARRCRKMVDVLEGKTTAAVPAKAPAARPTAARAAPKPRPAAPKPPAADGASTRLKEATAALESEESERSELKDVVDARVAGWKTGKEANVRALIASLDSVLWPELGWQKVGLHELVTDKQVKVRYTRAIGKLHPDKLAVGKTTVEQRMIAGAVFGILNEAWNASQK